MSLIWLRRTQLFLLSAAACLIAGAATSAETAPTDIPGEPEPSFLGIELPLRPGERLVPTADGNCSVVIFAPHEERYERLAGYWSRAQWLGPCRFGLAHGEGLIVGTDGFFTLAATMLYGLEVTAPEISRAGLFRSGEISWDTSFGTLTFHTGEAFSDTSAARYVVRYESQPDGPLEFDDLVSVWSGTNYLEKHTYDADGREWTMTVSAWNVDTYCGLGMPPEFKPFEKEVKKACKKNAREKLVVLRREGHQQEPWASRDVTWLKSCPVNRNTRGNECGKLVSQALGKQAAEFENLLTKGDAEARSAAEQEILDRYAPLEEAVEDLMLATEETPE